MSKIRFQGPLKYRLSSFLALNKAVLSTYARRLFGRKMEPSWSAHMEIGIRFWRGQFTKAMSQRDMQNGRLLFNSLMTETDDIYDVIVEACTTYPGNWYCPQNARADVTLLYLHGGGYTFSGPAIERYAKMLAHHSQTRIFMPHYRLTPEHAHPAQAEDAFAAWKFVTQHTPQRKSW